MTQSPPLTRRRFLQRAAATSFASGLLSGSATFAQPRAQTLTIGRRTIEVMGRAASVYGITDSEGRSGLIMDQEDGFDVRLINDTKDETLLHWHGLTPAFELDGNILSQPLVPAGGTYDYQFDLPRSGTNWMHSHHGLHEASLMAAPLIVQSHVDRAADRQDVVMMLHDFSFTPPEELFAALVGEEGAIIGSGTAAMDHNMVRTPMAGMDHSQMQMGGAMQMDLNDISFDAFLANDRTLDDPEVVSVDNGGLVRLRIINAASSTNFWIDLGAVAGALVAVDGMDVRPVFGTVFEIAMAQRIDIELLVPAGGAVPVLAQREGDKARTGLILATPGAAITRIAGMADSEAGPVLTALERRLSALSPLPERRASRAMTLDLTGDMMGYIWGMNGLAFDARQPLDVASGERIEITFRNTTMMSHPMHLHGHHFQVVGLGQARLSGAMRDTVLVPSMDNVTIAFDTDNAGEWLLHCHNLYHMAAGMMTTVRYI